MYKGIPVKNVDTEEELRGIFGDMDIPSDCGALVFENLLIRAPRMGRFFNPRLANFVLNNMMGIPFTLIGDLFTTIDVMSLIEVHFAKGFSGTGSDHGGMYGFGVWETTKLLIVDMSGLLPNRLLGSLILRLFNIRNKDATLATWFLSPTKDYSVQGSEGEGAQDFYTVKKACSEVDIYG